VLTLKAKKQVRFQDANSARQRISGTVTLLRQAGDLIIPVTFFVVKTVSVPVILGCAFIADNAQAIHPKDRSIHWTEASVTDIMRRLLDDGDRPMGASCVFRSS